MSVFTNDITVEPGTSPLSVTGSSVSVSNLPVTQPVSGSVSVSNFPATQPVTGTFFQATQPVSIAGTVSVTSATGSTATITQVVMVNNTNNTVLASNPNRKSAIIFVPTQPMKLAFSTAPASATNFTYSILANATIVTITGYTGQINGFGQNNTLNVTEVV